MSRMPAINVTATLLGLLVGIGCNCNSMRTLRSSKSPTGNYEAVLALDECVRPLGSDRYKVVVYELPRRDGMLFSTSRKLVLYAYHAEALSLNWAGERKLILSCRSCDIQHDYILDSTAQWNGITLVHDGF